MKRTESRSEPDVSIRSRLVGTGAGGPYSTVFNGKYFNSVFEYLKDYSLNFILILFREDENLLECIGVYTFENILDIVQE